MVRQFIWIGDNDNGEWIDSTYIDTCKNSDKREWILSTNAKTGEQYSQLLRAKCAESDYDFSVILPRKFTYALSNCAV